MDQSSVDQPTGVTIAWAAPGSFSADAACRSCGAPGGKPVLLDARAYLPVQGHLSVRLLDCPNCGCAFVETVPAYDYEGQSADALSVATYAEAGAGLWPIVRTLARLPAPPGARFLEVGCGFGFGLDFAQRARGWAARGVDPSPLAAAGRAMLGVPIESRFFGSLAGDEAGPGVPGADVVLASEVLEHVADPRGFLGLLRRAMAPGATLVVTTPDRAQLRPDAGFSTLVPILSVGAHLTLQTAASLRGLLAQAGFGHVHVEANGAQLLAYASDGVLALEMDDAALRPAYRGYLAGRIATVEDGTALWWGFAGRAFQEAVADHDGAAADEGWAMLRAACARQYGFDPEAADSVPRGVGCDLAGLAALVPKAMPGLLYARALHLLRGGARLADVRAFLAAAVGSAQDLNAALLALGAADLSAVAAERESLAALMAAAADEGASGSLDALALAVGADPQRGQALARRCFVGLVNAGAFALAGELMRHWDIGAAGLDAWPAGVRLDDAGRDTLFCLGMLGLQSPGQEEAVIRRLTAVRAAVGDDAVGLGWAALRGVCVALDRLGRHSESVVLLEGVGGEGMPGDLRLRMGG